MAHFMLISCQIEEDARLLRITQELECMAGHVLEKDFDVRSMEMVRFSRKYGKH